MPDKGCVGRGDEEKGGQAALNEVFDLEVMFATVVNASRRFAEGAAREQPGKGGSSCFWHTALNENQVALQICIFPSTEVGELLAPFSEML